MSRKLKKRSARQSVVLLVDGETEKYYLNQVKEHYDFNIKVTPELIDKSRKKVDELFQLAQEKVGEGYSHVVVVMDLDVVLRDGKECQCFQKWYNKYRDVQQGVAPRRNAWMAQVMVVINNPCLEYWFLLHFNNTNAFYDSDGPIIQELQKHVELKGYEKSGRYYNSAPIIYDRLKDRLNDARKNARRFDISICKSAGCSEMNMVFDLFDKLNKLE